MRNARYNFNCKRVIISRTDSIGDVVLTLPMTAVLKRLFPLCTVIFLGRNYTRCLVECCEHVDEFADWENLRNQASGLSSLKADAIIHVFPKKEIAIAARKAKIAVRAGSTGRFYHWGNCNKIIRLSRRHSSLHEAQLNLKLLVPFGAKRLFFQEEIPDLFGLTKIPHLSNSQKGLLDSDRFNLILHPGSKGSAREWGLHNFAALIKLLPHEKFRIFISGTKAEGENMQEEIFSIFPHLVNICGAFDLKELIGFIANADGLIAASTGPLHIASALGRNVIGLFPPIKPMHPGRWAPIGNCAFYLSANHNCNICRNNTPCKCMQEITPEMLMNKLFEIFH